MRRERYPWARPIYSIQAEVALWPVGIGQEAGASPADGSFNRSEVQMASRLAHNQEIVSSILTAAIFSGPLRGPTARRLSHKEETVGRHLPERFPFHGFSVLADRTPDS